MTVSLGDVDVNVEYDVNATVDYLRRNGHTRVALQFPDELLCVSPSVSRAIQVCYASHKSHEEVSGISSNGVSSQNLELFVLADSTYGSCCVDEVAAAHVAAHCVVHYGHACFSQTSRMPALFVLGSQPLNTERCVAALKTLPEDSNDGRPKSLNCLVLFDLVYANAMQRIQHILQHEHPHKAITIASVAGREMVPHTDQPASGSSSEFTSTMGGLSWSFAEGTAMEDVTVVWIGNEGPALTNFMLTLNTCKWLRFDPQLNALQADIMPQSAFLRRRYYLMERAKDASIVGIVAGTLGVGGYLSAIAALQQIIHAAGKKTYIIAVGKPNPAKLANFPECEVFVLVACPFTVLLDSKEYMAPVITPFEANIAFCKWREWSQVYELGFSSLLQAENPSNGTGTDLDEEPRFSFLKGHYVFGENSTGLPSEQDKTSAVVHSAENNRLVIKSEEPTTGLQYFHNTRQFKGLDVPPHMLEQLGLDASSATVPVGKVEAGSTGRAASYSCEGK